MRVGVHEARQRDHVGAADYRLGGVAPAPRLAVADEQDPAAVNRDQCVVEHRAVGHRQRRVGLDDQVDWLHLAS